MSLPNYPDRLSDHRLRDLMNDVGAASVIHLTRPPGDASEGNAIASEEVLLQFLSQRKAIRSGGTSDSRAASRAAASAMMNKCCAGDTSTTRTPAANDAAKMMAKYL